MRASVDKEEKISKAGALRQASIRSSGDQEEVASEVRGLETTYAGSQMKKIFQEGRSVVW